MDIKNFFFKGKNFAHKNYERVKIFFPTLVSCHNGRKILCQELAAMGNLIRLLSRFVSLTAPWAHFGIKEVICA
jgi:hypothetical protein